MTFSSTQRGSPVRDAALHVPQASRAMHRVDAPAGRDRLPALDRRLLEQYFNTYCRETGRFDPRVTDDAGLADDLRRAAGPGATKAMPLPAWRLRTTAAGCMWRSSGFRRWGSTGSRLMRHCSWPTAA